MYRVLRRASIFIYVYKFVVPFLLVEMSCFVTMNATNLSWSRISTRIERHIRIFENFTIKFNMNTDCEISNWSQVPGIFFRIFPTKNPSHHEFAWITFIVLISTSFDCYIFQYSLYPQIPKLKMFVCRIRKKKRLFSSSFQMDRFYS